MMNPAIKHLLKTIRCLSSLPLVCILLFITQPIFGQQTTIEGAQTLKAYFKGKTKPLRELAPMPGTDVKKRTLKKANKPNFTPPNFINWRRQPKVNLDALPHGVDPIRQDNYLRTAAVALVEPNFVIEGIDETTSNVGVPDTNGDASPDHYIQIVNASWFQIFDKEGNALTQPTSANTIWSEINQQSFSDPVIMYDEEAGRWLLTDLAAIDVVLYGVSETSDPMGAWNLYTLNTPGFADYPKYGIWPNAYIFTINEGQGVYPVYALNRQEMLNGDNSVDVQRIEIPGLNGGFPTATPMDWNSPLAPPSDEVFVARLNDDAWGNGNNEDLLEIWTINLDWGTPANTSTVSLQLPTTPYDTDGCSINTGGFACIPQPGTTQGIDGIMTIIMNNICYWNYGTHESAALTFSVDAGGDVAGIRWMELRRLPGGSWTIHQEGTYAPNDDVHRFIPGIAINGKGDIGLAYAVSGDDTFPGLRFTGRREGDPLGEMTVDEYEFAPGAGIRTTSDRYGDYAHMSVDPIDGSFWFTSEYTKANGSFGTKIVNFSLTRDTLDIGPVSLDAPQDSPDLTNSELVTIGIKNHGLDTATNIMVGYIFENGAAVMEPATIDLLAPDSLYTHTFTPTVDMSTIGSYDFKVFATFPEDQNIPNDTLRRVRRKLPRFDAGITNIEGLDATLCDSSVTVVLTLTNFGTETLTSTTIQYQLNGGATQSMDWTGSLSSGESTEISLLVEPLINGTNSLATNTFNPNAMTDEIPSNDGYSRDFQVVLGGVSIMLELSFDFFSQETSWQLQDDNGTIVYSGGPYPGQPFETVNEEWCLVEEECYTFTIFDSYGDGVINTAPFGDDGSYNITDADGNSLASIMTINFGFQEDNEFCVGVPCNVTADFDVTNESNSGNNDGAILVSPSSGTSPFTYSLDGSASQTDAMFSGLSGGNYTVVVTDANGCTFEEEVTIETLVPTVDLEGSHTVTVYPNPSELGAFWLKIEGLGNVYSELDLQIVDAIGQPVLYETLTLVDGDYKGLVSLYNYPAGIYYIRFKNKDINELVKIIRL